MRHFLEMPFRVFGPVLLVGKGPSFCPQKVSEYKARGFLLCGLNEAFAPCRVTFDLTVFHDWPVTKFFKDSHRVKFFIAASKPLVALANFFHALEYSDEYKDRIYFYDGPGGPTFPDKEGIEVKLSVSEAAVKLLAMLGAREIHFLGVDGTYEHSPFFIPRPIRHGTFARQFETFAKLQRIYKLTYVNLPSGYDEVKRNLGYGT